MKTWGDLAIFGGKPAFEKPLHVGYPNIGNRAALFERINDILDRRWLTNMGPYSQEFERRISEMLGVKHCIAMCNGTVALEIAIRALGLTGEVIVPSMTFIATVHALQWQEVTPIFCDIAPGEFHLDPEKVEAMITPRTTGIIGVHLWGRPCHAEALTRIAQKRGLKLLFDAAHAFGCSHNGRMIGNFGNAEVFSFHATKCINTFEGGAIVTNDDELAEKIRLMTNFGFGGTDKVVYIGTNGKMNEVSAAMGITSLEDFETFIELNRSNYQTYVRELTGIRGLRPVMYDEQERNNYHYVVLELDEAVTAVSRDQVVDILRAENVLARRYFYPGCHNMEPYRSYFPLSQLWLPETERMAKRVLVLPTGAAVTAESIKLIGQIIRVVVGSGREIRDRLKHLLPLVERPVVQEPKQELPAELEVVPR
ncbi:MAG: aminotransferase class I/II-fold pyridoxal phosphate-dependent enzyme [Nitrospira sp. CR1.1]|jgi:dTDP-4-amino-4,6-dideoxygalactose transaminase|nr:aminotransferase class I/II-fold pyridoxal phosphate-dependent enzyme [Nitrospira sp. CR1.1]